MSDDIAFRSATDLAQLIRDRQISSAELTEHYIARIERLDETINAVVVRDFDQARASAAEADKTLASGADVGPLHGLPFTIKEAYHVAGHPTTFGHPSLAQNIPDWNSDVVKSLRAAGAVFMGKTNVPVDCADHQSYNDVYGTTNNPWNTECVPGGSSGGSAASLAAGFTTFEMGSDIGGSIRIPANYCGVYGHKSTWGIVSERGHGTSMAPGADTDLNVCGPLARNAADLGLVLNVVAGPNALNRRGWQLNLPRPQKKSLSEYRVVLWPDNEHAPVQTEIADAIQNLGDNLAKLGVTVSDSARPDYDLRNSVENYLYLLHSQMGAGVTGAALERNQKYAAAVDPNDHSDAAILSKGLVLSHADWLRAHGRRERVRAAWDAFFQDWDIVICPVHQRSAFPHDHRKMSQRTQTINGAERHYMESLFWAGVATGALLPSTAFPIGLSSAGLPFGTQAFGNAYHDHTTIDFTRLLEQEFGGFMPPPDFA